LARGFWLLAGKRGPKQHGRFGGPGEKKGFDSFQGDRIASGNPRNRVKHQGVGVENEKNRKELGD